MMTNPVVIDTNVLLVANCQHADVSEECVIECVRRLKEIQSSGCVVVDDAWRIINEYRNKTSPNQPKGVGDIFLKWLLQNVGNVNRVHQVPITTENNDDKFLEFPDLLLQDQFDPPDRKFPAVANAHPNKPNILQAADCKWLDWRGDLKAKGISVEFLCPNDVCKFYSKKFPDNDMPDLS